MNKMKKQPTKEPKARAKKERDPNRPSVIPLMTPPQLKREIEDGAAAMCKHQSDVMRLSISIGLRVLRSMNYDETGAILGSVRPAGLELVRPDRMPLRERRSK